MSPLFFNYMSESTKSQKFIKEQKEKYGKLIFIEKLMLINVVLLRMKSIQKNH